MNKFGFRLLTLGMMSSMLILSGCGGDGDSGGTNTSISGKVTLSSVVGAKPGRAPVGKPGTRVYKSTSRKAVTSAANLGSNRSKVAFSNAEIFLYDANHPEWSGPVANTTTDATGAYTLDKLSGAVDNDNAYSDGATIPQGNYTLIASDYDPALGAIVVAIQNIAQDFSGAITDNNLEAVPSDVEPTVDNMFGQSKNLDGTETWGSAAVTLPPNASIQVTFNMTMARDSVTVNGVDISPAVTGSWEISPDWLTATFHPTTTLASNTEYTVTVKGDDISKGDAVKNVYGNRLAATAVGTFTTTDKADTEVVAPTFSLSGTSVSATATLELMAAELLDMSRLTLDLTPSLGKKPQAIYQGVDANGKHVYELATANALAVGEAYAGSITGIKDLAGNEVTAAIAVDFTVASSVDGVTLSDDADIATVQTAAAGLFSKWIASMDNRDLAKWQGLTAGSFKMDYNVSADGFDSEVDINRDGVYSLDEFSSLLRGAFLMWDLCKTTIGGDIVGTMNVDAANEIADFEFKLTGTSVEGGQDCSDATPNEAFYATIRKISGSWKVEKASVGIDTRKTEIAQASILQLVGPKDDAVFADNQEGPPAFKEAETTTVTVSVTDDTTDPATTTDTDYTFSVAAGDALKFQWAPVDAAASYVFIVMAADDPENGMALIMPSDKTALDFADPCAMPPEDGGGDTGGTTGGDTGGGAAGGCDSGNVMVNDDFGFGGRFEPQAGSALLWQIAALGTNTADMVKNNRNSSLAKDVTAISKLRRVLIDGVPVKMGAKVNAIVTGSDVGVPVTFNEIIRGFDVTGVADHTGEVVIVATAESLVDLADGVAAQSQNMGGLRVEGAVRVQEMMDFDPDTNPTGVVAGTITRNKLDGTPITIYTYKVKKRVMLSQGWNDVELFDRAEMGQNQGEVWPSRDSKVKRFQIRSAAGFEPLLTVASLCDGASAICDSTTALTGNAWGEYEMPAGSTGLTLKGTIATGYEAMRDINVNLWNDKLQINKHVSIGVTAGSFEVDLDIYEGFNWINIDGEICETGGVNCTWATTHFGVETDTGATYVAPIAITSVVDSVTPASTLTAIESFGDFARYDASLIASDSLLISGTMQNGVDQQNTSNRPQYGAGGEGGWQGGDLTVASDGSFSITIELFNGYNNVHFSDVSGNWYNLEIFTTAGKPVIKPTILTVNDVAYVEPDRGGMGRVTVDSCSVKISGTAKKGEVRTNWRGEDFGVENDFTDDKFHWEEQSVLTSDTANADGVYPFEVTLPVISGATAKNFYDINDSTWNWTGLEVVTTAACTYAEPIMTVGSVTSVGGALAGVLANDGTVEQPQYNAVDATSVTIAGTSNRAGRSIKVEMNACGSRDIYTATANDAGAWTVPGVLAYQGMWHVNVSDGVNQSEMQLESSNGVQPTPPINVTLVEVLASTSSIPGTVSAATGGGCGMGDWNADAATFGTVELVKITGTSKAKSAQHYYWAGSQGGEFMTDADGAFSFDVAVTQGFNNIWINDPEWNGFGVNMQVETGQVPPQYIVVDSVAHGATLAAGIHTIEGTIYVESNAGGATPFKPERVDAEVWSDTGSARFSNDANAFDADTMNFKDNGDGTFTFSFDITIGTQMMWNDVTSTEEEVPAEARVNIWADSFDGNHGLEIVLNPFYDDQPRFWKSGAKATGGNKSENPVGLIQNMLETKAKFWNGQ